MRSEIEKLRGKQHPVRGDDKNIGLRTTDNLRFRCAQALGLRDAQPARKREPFDRTRHRLQAAPRRAVGLRDNEGNLVSGFEQPVKRLSGELRSAGED